MKQRGQSFIFFALAIISLLLIGGLFGTGILKSWSPTEGKNKEKTNILGETIESKAINPLSTEINRFIQEATQETKGVTAQKLEEIEKTIINTVQKEISSLSQSQMKLLQIQICKDWGVITPVPTTTP